MVMTGAPGKQRPVSGGDWPWWGRRTCRYRGRQLLVEEGHLFRRHGRRVVVVGGGGGGVYPPGLGFSSGTIERGEPCASKLQKAPGRDTCGHEFLTLPGYSSDRPRRRLEQQQQPGTTTQRESGSGGDPHVRFGLPGRGCGDGDSPTRGGSTPAGASSVACVCVDTIPNRAPLQSLGSAPSCALCRLLCAQRSVSYSPKPPREPTKSTRVSGPPPPGGSVRNAPLPPLACLG